MYVTYCHFLILYRVLSKPSHFSLRSSLRAPLCPFFSSFLDQFLENEFTGKRDRNHHGDVVKNKSPNLEEVWSRGTHSSVWRYRA